MNLMIASDLHGSGFYTQKLMDAFAREGCGRLLLLGDLLYHGPRNALPHDYDPKAVIAQLSAASGRLLCVRGNCDTEVDQMVLPFPIMADYCVLWTGERTIYAAHGHHFSEQNPPPLSAGDILLCGHTHVPRCAEHEHFVYLNPGSVSIPKEGSPHSYMTFDGTTFVWKTLEGEEYRRYTL